MSAKAKVKQTTTTRQKKTDGDMLTCPICAGKGKVPKGYNKKKGK